jgi:hypothetical protein
MVIPDQSQRLGLVAETLFMAVLLHALLALVLVDLGLTAFFDGAHGGSGLGVDEKLGDDFTERILDDPLGPQTLQFGDNVSDDDFVNHCLNRDPTFFRKLRNRGSAK